MNNYWFHTPCQKCFYRGNDLLGKRAIVSFDFDDTLVYNSINVSDSSGKIMPNVKDKLKELSINFDIVIFTIFKSIYLLSIFLNSFCGLPK